MQGAALSRKRENASWFLSALGLLIVNVGALSLVSEWYRFAFRGKFFIVVAWVGALLIDSLPFWLDRVTSRFPRFGILVVTGFFGWWALFVWLKWVSYDI